MCHGDAYTQLFIEKRYTVYSKTFKSALEKVHLYACESNKKIILKNE